MADDTLFGYRLREHQQRVLAYQSGRMAISAVPGSGKTLTLALLAARLIVEGRIGDEGEVLVVTVQNSAVDNISARIRRILVEQRMPPVGYHVCTLHKLAADILRQRHDLAGVDEQFAIVDDVETQRLIHLAAEAWISDHRALWLSFLPESAPNEQVLKRWRQETEQIGKQMAKLCKHLRLAPPEALALLKGDSFGVALARLGVALYSLYTEYLHLRGGLDFDDLIWRATTAIEQDATFLLHLRDQWPYILEDEAQDSSPLQEAILDRLSDEQGNWVRVGDPNQAINSTFTAADPRFFRSFLRREHVDFQVLLESGRCARPIMAMADALAHWGALEHPSLPVRAMSFEPQRMQPTEEGDPQPNPPDSSCHVRLATEAFDKVDTEATKVAQWAATHIRHNPQDTVAVLCPAAWQGGKVVEALQALPDVPFDDLLRSTPQARNVARVLARALHYLADPTQANALATLYRALAASGLLPEAEEASLRRRATLLRSIPLAELLYPRAEADWTSLLPPRARHEQDLAALDELLSLARRWVNAVHLPADQLTLAIAQDLFSRPEDERYLAICHTIASSQRGALQMHPAWSLADLAGDLEDVAHNRRGLGGLSLPDAGYEPVPGRVVVTTMHKAKGLEWDTVFLLCVDDLEFPHALDGAFRGEPFYLPGHAPSIEARKTLERLAQPGDAAGRDPVAESRLEVIAERLRLLYVGVTRARRNLAITYSRNNGSVPVQPALALDILRAAYDGYVQQGEVEA
jgi:DNA helicase-2/ATP-dependent DNA helicase PcrA